MEYNIFQGRLFRIIVSTVGILLVVFLIAAIAVKAHEVRDIYTRAAYPSKTIVVNATGKSKGVPDVAYLNFSVTGTGKDAASAQDDSLAKIKVLKDFLAAQGIDKEDIVSSASYGGYGQPSDPPPAGTVQDSKIFSVEVKNSDPRALEEKITALFKGIRDKKFLALNLAGSCLTFEKPERLLAPAFEEALMLARERAHALAYASGLTLGRTASVTDNSQSYSYSPTNYNGPCAITPIPDTEILPQELVSTLMVTFEVR